MSPSQKHLQAVKLVSPVHSRRTILNVPGLPPTSLHGSSRNTSAGHRLPDPHLAIKIVTTIWGEDEEVIWHLPTGGEAMTTSTSDSRHKPNVESCGTSTILLQLQTNQIHPRPDGH